MDPFIIRFATIADIDDMVGLLNQLFSLEQDFVPDAEKQRRGLVLFLEECGKHRCLLVADIFGRARGMVSAQILISTAEGSQCALMEDLVVDAAYRGRGLGRALLTAVEVQMAKRGITRLQLLVDMDNIPAFEFYKACLWQQTRLICLRRYPGLSVNCSQNI